MARVAPALDGRARASRREYQQSSPVAYRPSRSIPGLPARSASSRARLNPRNLDFIMTEFLQEYPLLEGMVYMESVGHWSLLGRQVVQIRSEAPLKGVLVDGIQRPLGDVLEEVLKEHQVELSMQAEFLRRQRLLSHIFQHRERQGVRRLMQSAWRGFQAAASFGRRVRHVVVRKWLILLRNSFLSWRGRVWRQHRQLKVLETLGDRHAAPLFRGLLWYAWHSWMAMVFQHKKYQDLSLRQREMLLSTVKVMKDAVPHKDLVPELFQRWRLQVQNDRRSLAEQVLLADAGRLRRETASLTRNASAKELLSQVLDGPEAQLSRLDTVVDQLLNQLATVRNVGGLTGSLRLAKSGASSPASPESLRSRENVLHEALLGLGSMLETQKAASVLRSDIQFVLCLRCLSAWVRYVADERFGRREADLGVRRSQERCRLRAKAHSLGHRMEQMALDSRLRSSFQDWEYLVRQGREASRSTRDIYAQQLTTARAVAKDRAARQAKLWEARNDEMVLQLILERWRAAHRQQDLADEPQWRSQQKERKLAKSLAAFGSSEVADRAMLQHTLIHWHIKTKSFKTAVFQVSSLIKGSENMQLLQVWLAWRDGHRQRKAKAALSYKVMATAFADSTSFVLSTCLHTWHTVVRKERMHSLRNNSKVKALRMAAQKISMASEVLLQVIFSRWLEVLGLLKAAEADARASRLRMLQERSKRILFHILRDMDIAILWSFFQEWHALARLTVEERKTAAEYLRRQRLLDVERRHVRFQTEIRPKIGKSVERAIELSEALHTAEVFDQWKLRTAHHRMVHETLRSQQIRERKDVLKFLLEAWRVSCIRTWLRGGGFRLGQAVVNWGNVAVLQASLAMWRTICLKHHAQFSAQQLFAAQSIGRAIEQSQRNALRHWSAQVLRTDTAQMQNKVKKMDMLHLASLFNSNADAEVEQRHWRLRTIFEAWRLGRQQMMMERIELRPAAQPRGDRSWLLNASRAIRRLARWRRVPEEMLAVLPETFAAWAIATIHNQMQCRAEAGRRNAWRCSQRTVTLQRLVVLWRGFWSFALCRARSLSRQRLQQLCRAVEVFSTRQVLLQWSQLVHSKWKSRTHREKHVFKAQATSIVRRVLRLSALELSSSFLQNVVVRWRQLSLTAQRLMRLQAQRCGARHESWDQHRLIAKIFGRWARSSFYARKEVLLSPKAVTFASWKAFVRGLRAADESQAMEGQLRELEGPGHAALVLRMAVLKRRCQRFQLRGVELWMDLRRQRQALCFGLWRLRCRFHRRVVAPPRPRSCLLLRAAFALWATAAERASSACLRRLALVESLGRVTLRTLATAMREVLLRKVWMSWLRTCH